MLLIDIMCLRIILFNIVYDKQRIRNVRKLSLMSGQAKRNSSSNSNDSLLEKSLLLDASVIITGYEKPWLDRSAISLDAGSDTDHEKIENNETALDCNLNIRGNSGILFLYKLQFSFY